METEGLICLRMITDDFEDRACLWQNSKKLVTVQFSKTTQINGEIDHVYV